MERRIPKDIDKKFKNDFEWTGNLAMDQIGCCYTHYKDKGVIPKEIRLRWDYFQVFLEYIKDVKGIKEIPIGTDFVIGESKITCGEEMDDRFYYMQDPLKVFL